MDVDAAQMTPAADQNNTPAADQSNTSTADQSNTPERSATNIETSGTTVDSSPPINPGNTRGFPFLSLPGEIRNKIYRLAFVYDEVITDIHFNSKSKKSAQFLRTCRQVHAEGMPILYGENTFQIEISNTFGPGYRCAYYSRPLHALFDYSPRPESQEVEMFEFEETLRRSLLRRFSVVIRYTKDHDIRELRNEVASAAQALHRGPREIDFLELKCELDCPNDNYLINWQEERWRTYRPNGSKDECITMIRAWWGKGGVCMGLGVKKVGEISGLPEKDALFLREHLGAPKRNDTDDGEQPVCLLDRYKHLCALTGATKMVYERHMWRALLAAERGDIEEFETLRECMLKCIRSLLEQFERDKR